MGKNVKAGSLKVTEKARKILDKYKNDKDETDLVLPELRSLRDLSDLYHTRMRIKFKVKLLNDALAEVKNNAEFDKPLTMHIPEHSFGNIPGDKIPVQILQKLYPHTRIKTIIGYKANFIHQDADDALDAVINDTKPDQHTLRP